MPEATPAPIACLVPHLPTADELLPYLRRIDANRWYSNFGPLLAEYEQALARELAAWEGGAPGLGCVSACSGHAALELVLEALDLSPGSAVLTPSLGFPATPAAILRTGHRPVFADVDESCWCLTPAIARSALARQSLAAVMPVAAYGLPLPVAEWEAFQDETGVPVLVDAAAALGRQGIGRLRAVVFSLHATKPLGVGEGGLVLSRDAGLLEKVHQCANFGFRDKLARRVAGNGKLSEYAAAVGLAQWRRRQEVWNRRETVWQAYARGLAPLRERGLRWQDHASAPGTLVVRLPMPADQALQALAARGIECRRWYCPPLHEHPAFAGQVCLPLPVTGALAGTLLGLPFHAWVPGDAVHRVVDALSASMHDNGA